MTLPQRTAPADPVTGFVPLIGMEFPDGSDRGPANAIIARLAQAIAEQNLANATDPVLSKSRRRSVPSVGWFVALGAGSATFWFAVILISRALL